MCVMQRKIVTQNYKIVMHAMLHVTKIKHFYLSIKKERLCYIRNVIFIVLENVIILMGRSHQFDIQISVL